MNGALAKIEAGGALPAPIENETAGFDFSDLRIFTSIPRCHHDVAVMHGLVVVYDTDCIGREGIQIGKLYIRESQRPYAMFSWEEWLKLEWEERDRRCGPSSFLRTRREVVQAVHHRHGSGLALRMATGGVDGPYHDWAFGRDLIGKVVGVYQPAGLKEPPNARS